MIEQKLSNFVDGAPIKLCTIHLVKSESETFHPLHRHQHHYDFCCTSCAIYQIEFSLWEILYPIGRKNKYILFQRMQC